MNNLWENLGAPGRGVPNVAIVCYAKHLYMFTKIKFP